ncbi:hypothetical protein PV410_12705 [Streptomyces sp. PA03-5A]|nr:hypothetical protein [Streptomyces sp. PA03-5A]
MAEIRGGASTARSVADPLCTVTASGNHHGLITPAMVMRNNGSKARTASTARQSTSRSARCTRRDRVRQYGNAVTPPAAEFILCALVECITGEEIDRHTPQDRFGTAA